MLQRARQHPAATLILTLLKSNRPLTPFGLNTTLTARSPRRLSDLKIIASTMPNINAQVPGTHLSPGPLFEPVQNLSLRRSPLTPRWTSGKSMPFSRSSIAALRATTYLSSRIMPTWLRCGTSLLCFTLEYVLPDVSTADLVQIGMYIRLKQMCYQFHMLLVISVNSNFVLVPSGIGLSHW